MFAPEIWRPARQTSSGFFFSRLSALIHSKESEANDKDTDEEDITHEDAVAIEADVALDTLRML